MIRDLLYRVVYPVAFHTSCLAEDLRWDWLWHLGGAVELWCDELYSEGA